jgi:CRISPR-associated exonuclease Cas4
MAKEGNYASVSELTSYAYCPRLCYFRQRFGERPSLLNAAKEIYLCLRKGLDLEWAKNRFISFGGSEEFFERAKAEFAPLKALQRYKPVEWEMYLYSKRYRLKGVVDELVYDSEIRPLAISLKSPKEGVWFKDAVKVASYLMLLHESDFAIGKVKSGLVYHCFDGVLREVEIDRRLRLHVMRLIERVLRLRRGFIPEKLQGKKCSSCSYFRDCEATKSTFASKFL